MRRKTATLGDALVLAGMWSLTLVALGFAARLAWWFICLGWSVL